MKPPPPHLSPAILWPKHRYAGQTATTLTATTSTAPSLAAPALASPALAAPPSARPRIPESAIALTNTTTSGPAPGRDPIAWYLVADDPTGRGPVRTWSFTDVIDDATPWESWPAVRAWLAGLSIGMRGALDLLGWRVVGGGVSFRIGDVVGWDGAGATSGKAVGK